MAVSQKIGTEKKLYQVTFGKREQRLFAPHPTVADGLMDMLEAKGFTQVHRHMKSVNPWEVYENATSMRAVTGRYSPPESRRLLFLAPDEETEAAVVSAIMLSRPDAELSGEWMLSPEWTAASE